MAAPFYTMVNIYLYHHTFLPLLLFLNPILSITSDCAITKIGEATYSEVYVTATFSHHSNAIMKIIPFNGTTLVNNAPQQNASDILQEVRVTSTLNKLAMSPMNLNFVRFLGCHVVKGCYPLELVDPWDSFDVRKKSQNIRPGLTVFV